MKRTNGAAIKFLILIKSLSEITWKFKSRLSCLSVRFCKEYVTVKLYTITTQVNLDAIYYYNPLTILTTQNLSLVLFS